MPENHSHLVEFDEDLKRVTIYRVLEDGKKVLFTYLELADYMKRNPSHSYQDMARSLGENIFLDSPAARRLFGL